MEINATPAQVHPGDTVNLRGSIVGIKTIAVYLFVTGPDLDTSGVTLENLNIPAGHGLFTTAPVNMKDGTWEYEWDTSVILGTLRPGTYTIYAVSTPFERLRFSKGEYAMAQVEFIPSEIPSEVPVDTLLPLAALVMVAGAGIMARCRSGSGK
jgi:hypothetical protein